MKDIQYDNYIWFGLKNKYTDKEHFVRYARKDLQSALDQLKSDINNDNVYAIYLSKQRAYKMSIEVLDRDYVRIYSPDQIELKAKYFNTL